MKILHRYITKTLLSYTLVVLVIWLGVYGFFNFLAELSSIGKENYTSLGAAKYIALQMPEIAYKHASPVILLGCVLGMGYLATTSQLLILRVSGLSIFKLTLLTARIALMFVVVLIVIGEIIAPMTSEMAEKSRAKDLGYSLASQSQQGFWIKEGGNYINVKKNFDGDNFSGVTLIQTNANNQVEAVITSDNANFDGDTLALGNTDIFSIDGSSNFDIISYKKRNSYNQSVSFDQDLIDSLRKEPEELTTWNIYKQIQFLSENKLNADIYEVELYKRLVKPLTLVAMILLAMLFIFGSNRDTSLGKKLFFGIALALSFELTARIGAAMSIGFTISPLTSAVLPSLTVMLLAIVLLKQHSTS